MSSIPVLQVRNQGSDRLCDLQTVVQLVGGKTRAVTQVCLQIQCCFSLHHVNMLSDHVDMLCRFVFLQKKGKIGSVCVVRIKQMMRIYLNKILNPFFHVPLRICFLSEICSKTLHAQCFIYTTCNSNSFTLFVSGLHPSSRSNSSSWALRKVHYLCHTVSESVSGAEQLRKEQSLGADQLGT